jgi:uncharacterized DUF497 family protein
MLVVYKMIDWTRIAGFDWDDGNRRKSEDKHDVSQSEAEQIFLFEPLLISADTLHSRTEVRFNALGQTIAGRYLHVTFTLRFDSTKIRVISARDMNRKERAIYGKEA